MIRKTVIAVLTLGAMGTAIIGASRLSTSMPIRIPFAGWLNIEFECWSDHNDTPTSTQNITIMRYDRGTKHDLPPSWKWKVWDYGFRSRYLTCAGMRVYPQNPDKTGWWGHGVEFSLWVVVMVFATYPAIAFCRGPLRRWRRRRKGRCGGCGYDLTGNVSGVCPECGEAT